ncbi:MAG: zinc-ribbon domain-containing protein, partial [Methanoregula sp.]
MNANPQTCPKCGSPVMPGMKFCESCGAKIEALPACPQCGAALAPDVKFCETCGAPVKTTTEGAAPVAAPVTPVPETTPIQESPPPVKETPAEVAAVAAPVAAAVAPVSESAPVKEVKPPAESPVKEEGKPVPATEEKPAPAPVRVKEPPKTEKIKETPKEAGPKKPVSTQTMIIAGVLVLAILGAAVYFVGLPMLSGSGTPPQNPPASPVTTNSGSSSGSSSGIPLTTPVTSQAMTGSFTPGPTQIPPSNLVVVLDAERDPITSIVSVTFKGGEGQFGVREIQVTLTRSDGSSETKSFKPNTIGSGVTIQGTAKTDRVEATAYFYNGEQYK